MSVFAPPTRRDTFLYSSLLYADAGNSNHHPRASVAELAALLRPEAPNLSSSNKKRKSENTAAPPTTTKDPPWHFWSAQLIHYGLAGTKDKNVAKVRLLDKLNQGQLEVPGWVGKVEAELKKEWEAENRRLKKAAAGGAVAGEKGGKKQDKGEKEDKKGAKGAKKEDARGQGVGSSQSAYGSGVNVNVNLTLSSGFAMMEQQAGVRKPKLTPSKPQPTKRKRAASDVQEVPTSAESSRGAPKTKSEPAPKKQAKTKESTPKTQVRKESASKVQVKKEATPKTQIKKESAPKTQVKKEPTSKTQVTKEPASTPSRARVKKEPNSPRSSYPPSSYIKPDPYTNSSSQNPPTLLLSGKYDVRVPYDNLYSHCPFTLTLFRDSSHSNTWWGTISWGPLSGLIKMDPGPSDFDASGTTCSLGWRLRDIQDNSLTFGRKCTGEMTFFRDQTFSGVLDQMPHMGSVEMEGTRQPGPGVVGEFQDEWEDFVREAYGR
ncbi:hypothetical protein N0V83_007578 [Neocucurbitaria cava]|uniref:Uncharacterized protein n=1 Tax=Neocucurbitaria cava TaxID=798079 RepID=A0A9W8Y4J9_9PLEO|nr:hypothetical protein N0V83_007578 [Neocucurbitaria cava]